jgi:hypothetical protein
MLWTVAADEGTGNGVSDWRPPMPGPIARPPQSRWLRTTVAVVCEVFVVVFFVATLHSVATDDIDGLNFLPNVLLGMPWNLVLALLARLLDIGGGVYAQATIDFLGASFNVLLLWLNFGRPAKRSLAP